MHRPRSWMTTLTLLAVTLPALPTLAQTPSATRQQLLAQAKDRAVETILTAAQSDQAVLRANAIEAMQPLPERALPLAQLGLDDPNPGVRFAALVTIGRLKLDGLGDATERLLDDPNPSVRAAAMFAAHQCGRPVDISAMAQMLTAPDPTLRGNVAMLLGLMDDPSAAPMLRDLAGAPMRMVSAVRQEIVRAQVAEAMIRLGDHSALDALRAAVFSQFDEVRVLAVSSLGKLGDRRMQRAFEHLLAKPPIELQLAAAEALARMDSPVGQEAMLAGAQSELAPVRAQAAFGLAVADGRATAEALVGLLEDPDPQVRISAAAAVLRALDAAAGGR